MKDRRKKTVTDGERNKVRMGVCKKEFVLVRESERETENVKH